MWMWVLSKAGPPLLPSETLATVGKVICALLYINGPSKSLRLCHLGVAVLGPAPAPAPNAQSCPAPSTVPGYCAGGAGEWGGRPQFLSTKPRQGLVLGPRALGSWGRVGYVSQESTPGPPILWRAESGPAPRTQPAERSLACEILEGICWGGPGKDHGATSGSSPQWACLICVAWGHGPRGWSLHSSRGRRRHLGLV